MPILDIEGRHRQPLTDRRHPVTTTPAPLPGGTWTMGDLVVHRFGFGAMQLAGPGVMGLPADRDGALAVLRDAVELGIDHLDTSAACGPGPPTS